jgi:hypothetical protein
MSRAIVSSSMLVLLAAQCACHGQETSQDPTEAPLSKLTLAFESPHWLVIEGGHVTGKSIRINYLEAYCRPYSTDADWDAHTVIPHQTAVDSLSDDRTRLQLTDRLADGVVVQHVITTGHDEVDFRLTAHNPTTIASEAHWAQACVRLGRFTGYRDDGSNLDDYLRKCFVSFGGQLVRLSDLRPWATEARYTPGQVWPAPGVPRTDVNPRPLSQVELDHGLIGAFSGDERQIFATSWQPYQELFQGVARCLHADLRLGGLAPHETKQARGKIYLVPNDVERLLARYRQDFPEQ